MNTYTYEVLAHFLIILMHTRINNELISAKWVESLKRIFSHNLRIYQNSDDFEICTM